jgi:serine protease Do
MRLRTWLGSLVLLAIAATLAAVSWPLAAQNTQIAVPPPPGPTAGAARAPESPAASAGRSYAKTLSVAFREAAERVLPAVVSIDNRQVVTEHPSPRGRDNSQEEEDDPLGDLRRFFGPRSPFNHRTMASGSGVIIDPSGVVLTNNHVVEAAGQITVHLHDGREFKGIDIKHDPRTDLAILRLKGTGPFPAAKLGNSDEVQVGDWVLAVGEPFHLEGTVTAGIISAKGRGLGIMQRESFLQTDAAINPGNSGGPLVNLDGEVVGINTAISSASGGYQGVGFAIPSALAHWVADQLIARGSVQRAYLGIVIQKVTPDLADSFGAQANRGVLVGEVRENTPAAKAGLRTGDVIVQFGGVPVNSPADLQGLVEQSRLGTRVPVTILRDGRQETATVTCEEQPKNYGMAEEEGPGVPAQPAVNTAGMEVASLTPDLAERLGVRGSQGVVITKVEPGSAAQMAELERGMVISEVNRRPIRNVEDFYTAVNEKSLAKGVLLLVRTDHGTHFVRLRAG